MGKVNCECRVIICSNLFMYFSPELSMTYNSSNLRDFHPKGTLPREGAEKASQITK
jgi:hypothetical protein